ncbi:MAG: POTRA domain-containing protein [Bacteroidota bacterium]
MRHPQFILCLFLLLYGAGTSGQEIRGIRFEGLKKTKVDYLAQFVKSKPGIRLDSTLLEQDRQRLANLEMLANATFEVATSDGKAEVTFMCTEVATLLPLFNFGGVEGNVWFLLGMSEANLRGEGHKFFGFYQYYDRSSVSTSLFLDRLNRSNWGLLLNFVKWGTTEPLFFDDGTATFDYDNFTYGAGAVYHFSFLSNLELSTAYFTEEYNRVDNAPIEGAPDRAKTRKQLYKVIHRLNKLNYHYYYLKGFSHTLNVEMVSSWDGDPGFQIVFNDFRVFHRTQNRGNIANRVRAGISTNRDNPFAPFVLDSYVNIRGVGNRVDRGTAMFIMNNEYRQTVYDRNWLAAQVVGFSDFGTWRSPGGDFSELVDRDSFEWFVGGGIRLIHKKIFNAIARIDYGVDMKQPRRNGFVIGVGQYF